MKKLFKSHNIAILIILIGGVLTLIAPAMLLHPAFYSFLDLSKGASIGDTIGGITAPIVGLMGAILIYLGFYQQVKANELQKKINEDQKEVNTKNEEWRKHEMSILELNVLFEMKSRLEETYWKTDIKSDMGIIFYGFEAFSFCVVDPTDSFSSITESGHLEVNMKFFKFVKEFSILNGSIEESTLIEKHKKWINREILVFYFSYIYTLLNRVLAMDFNKFPYLLEFEDIKSDYRNLIEVMDNKSKGIGDIYGFENKLPEKKSTWAF